MTDPQFEIRVVIPAFNAEKTIVPCVEAILESLEAFPRYEIVIVDNGRNPRLKELTCQYPVTILERFQTESASYARNEGANNFGNGYLLFIDCDVVCEKQCIQELIAPIHKGEAQACVGNYSTNVKDLTFTQTYKQLYINLVYNRNGTRILNDFWTAISCIDAEIFHKLNGFRLDFKGARGEDQELGMRLNKKGYKVAFARNATGQHFHTYGIYKLFKNDFKKGLNIIKNSLENKVALTDNRHSKIKDVLSVLFSILTLISFFFDALNPKFILISLLFFTLWIFNRNDLVKTFYRNGGRLFSMKAIILMYFLDLVRFSCVVIGYVQYRFLGIEIIK